MASMKLDVEKFTGKNDYGLWKIKIKALLTQHGLADALKPPHEVISTVNQERMNGILDKAHSDIILCLRDRVLRKVEKKKKGFSKLNYNKCSRSPSSKEKINQAESPQGFQVLGSGKENYADTNSSSKLEETEHQALKLDVLGQPSTSGVKEGETSLRSQKGPKWVDTNIADYPRLWALKGANPNDVRRWCEFGALASICTIAPGFREISELPDWVLNAIVESWHNNPHLKRGDELEIKFITMASEDTTNAIQYPSFHFMKLQRPDKKVFTYINE
ncbi:hypothetical protein ACS0TY_018874 [Phlomoides rotata]